jgi:Leucine-rich repeat (LRR) protein
MKKLLIAASICCIMALSHINAKTLKLEHKDMSKVNVKEDIDQQDEEYRLDISFLNNFDWKKKLPNLTTLVLMRCKNVRMKNLPCKTIKELDLYDTNIKQLSKEITDWNKAIPNLKSITIDHYVNYS